MNKKADVTMDWAEYLAGILLAAGLVVSIVSKGILTTYVLSALFGLMFGRTLYRFQDKYTIPLYVIMIGFLAGFLIGSFEADRRIVILLYILGIVVSYWLHNEGLVKSVEF